MQSSGTLDHIKRVHFVGIGGSGMSPLAEILHEQGYIITGSDWGESDNIHRLEGLGIHIYRGHAAENLGDSELLVYTSAVSSDNPELCAANAQGVPTIERGALLGEITRRYGNTIAVAGTHGKTSTSSMLSHTLLKADLDPSVFIGGRLPLIGANGRAGKSDTMVCEACEFQDHYLSMRPAVGIILNVDADHLEYFGSLEGVIASFRKFSELCGTLIVNADDANTLKAIEGLDKPVITCGLTDGSEWQAKNITCEDLKPYTGLPLGGYKFRMHQMSSAVGRVQLKYYDERCAEIRKAMNYFWDLLEGVPGIRAHRVDESDGSNMGGFYNAHGLYVPEELGGLSVTRFCEALRAEGVADAVPGVNAPLHAHGIFQTADVYHAGKPTRIANSDSDVRELDANLGESENIPALTFGVPWLKKFIPAEIEEYANAFRKVCENYKELLPGDTGNPPQVGGWHFYKHSDKK